MAIDELYLRQYKDRKSCLARKLSPHLTAKVQTISGQIAALETLKGELQGILNQWQEQPEPDRITRTICPNIQRD